MDVFKYHLSNHVLISLGIGEKNKLDHNQMNLSSIPFLLLCLTIILIIAWFVVNNANKSKKSGMKRKLSTKKYRSSNGQDIEYSLANLSGQISSYLGYDGTGGRFPYNSSEFQQYLLESIQDLSQLQSSGSILPQFGQYIGKLLKYVQDVGPLESGSFDSQQMGIIAGQLYLCSYVFEMGGKIEWEGASSDIIQDVGEAVQTYMDWLGGQKSSSDAGTYLKDPVIYNLKLDADAGYPDETVQVLDQITASAEVDAWHLGSNNLNIAQAWYDLGMFIGFKCVYTADGNTC